MTRLVHSDALNVTCEDWFWLQAGYKTFLNHNPHLYHHSCCQRHNFASDQLIKSNDLHSSETSVQLPKPPPKVCISPTVAGHVCTGAWPSQVRRRRPNQSTPHMSPPYLQNTISTQTDQKAAFWKQSSMFLCCRDTQRLFGFKYVFELMLGGMTKNLYHGIFQNYTVFTVLIFFMHNCVLTTFSTGRERKNCSRLTYYPIL